MTFSIEILFPALLVLGSIAVAAGPILSSGDAGRYANAVTSPLGEGPYRKVYRATPHMRRAGLVDSHEIRKFLRNVAIFRVIFSVLAASLITAFQPGAFLSATAILVFILVMAIAPRLYLINRASLLREEMEKAFPEMLDLIRICLEAGQDQSRAMTEAAAGIEDICPSLSREIRLSMDRISAGADRIESLRSLSERCNLPEMSGMIEAMIQVEQLGGGLSGAIRIYGETIRKDALNKAEEQANLLSTRLMLGTMIFGLPPVMIVLVGPSVREMILSFSGM